MACPDYTAISRTSQDSSRDAGVFRGGDSKGVESEESFVWRQAGLGRKDEI